MKKFIIASLAVLISTAANAEYIEAPAFPEGKAQANETIVFNNVKGGDNVANTVEFTYGFTDWLAVVAAFNSRDAQHEERDYYSSGDYTAQIDLFKEGDAIPGTALRLTYSDSSTTGEPDRVSTMAVFAKKIGKFDNFLNLALSKEVGKNSTGGLGFSGAAQSMYNICDKWQLGAEYWYDMGKVGGTNFQEQGNQFGPIIGYFPTENISASATLLAGISKASPDSALIFELNVLF